MEDAQITKLKQTLNVDITKNVTFPFSRNMS